jgi:serine protease Do
VEGTQLKRNLDFSRVMLGRSAGEKVQLAVRRPGKSLDVELTLSSVGDEWRSAADFAWEVLGVRLEPVPAKEFPSKYRTSYRGGLSITAVEPSGPAGKRGVAVGDVLVQMDAWETVSVSDVLYVLRRPDFGSAPLEFYVLRGNQMFCGYLPAAVATALRP